MRARFSPLERKVEGGGRGGQYTQVPKTTGPGARWAKTEGQRGKAVAPAPERTKRLQDRCSRSGERRVHACVRTTLSARKPDLDMYGEDSAQEGTQVFCDRGRQKRMNAGCSPTSKNSRNIIEPHRLCPGQVSVQRHLTGQHVGTWEMGTLSTGEVPKNTRWVHPWLYHQDLSKRHLPWHAFPAWQCVMWFKTFFMVRQCGSEQARTSPLACSRLWHLWAWSSRTSCCCISLRFSGSAVGPVAIACAGTIPTDVCIWD